LSRIAVLTSGGDAPGMNAAVRAVVRKCVCEGIEILGVERGFSGLVNREISVMNVGSVADVIHRGGTMLKTARCEDFYDYGVQEEAANYLRELNIHGLVVIGGDGSYRGAWALREWGINTVGLPGTIDNDLPLSDTTIGFDTALNTVTGAINNLRDTATSHERVYVLEVMGKDTGNLALMAGLAGGAETILVPEVEFNLEEVCRRLFRGMKRGKSHSIILVAEGAASAIEVGKEIKNRTGMETRVTILGHLQRGGVPTAFDRILASRMGARAVDLLKEGTGGGAVCMCGSELVFKSFEEIFSSPLSFDHRAYELAGILSI